MRLLLSGTAAAAFWLAVVVALLNITVIALRQSKPKATLGAEIASCAFSVLIALFILLDSNETHQQLDALAGKLAEVGDNVSSSGGALVSIQNEMQQLLQQNKPPIYIPVETPMPEPQDPAGNSTTSFPATDAFKELVRPECHSASNTAVRFAKGSETSCLSGEFSSLTLGNGAPILLRPILSNSGPYDGNALVYGGVPLAFLGTLFENDSRHITEFAIAGGMLRIQTDNETWWYSYDKRTKSLQSSTDPRRTARATGIPSSVSFDSGITPLFDR